MGIGRWTMAPVFVATSAVLFTACSSKSGPPDEPIGKCALYQGGWYCGGSNQPIPDCEVAPTNGEGCSTARTGCFSCQEDTYGVSCSCDEGDGGVLAWNCIASGTACSE